MNTVIQNVVKRCFTVLCILAFSAGVQAQDTDDKLSGYWKHEKESIYIKVVNNDGIYEAEMVRNDWSPHLVGTRTFQNAVQSKSNRWTGEAEILDSDEMAKVSLRLSGNRQLTIRLRPGGRTVWERSEPIQKRY